MTQNQIAYQTHLENKRANEAREAETHRSNLANETENRRFHTESIQETQRANVARETETNRSNLANEMLKATEIKTKSEDARYAADVGYQGRVDAAYINQWGVSPTDVSSLAKSIGSGVAKAAPAAKGVAKAALDTANTLAAQIALAPVKAATGTVDAARQVRKSAGKILQPANKSTNFGSKPKTQIKSKIGGQNNVEKKKSKLQKY